MLLTEHFPSLVDWRVRILATDLSRDVLARAKAGCYSQIEVNRGLPITYLVKYFEKHGAEWRLVPRIRERVEFQQMNLVQAWPMMPAFDVFIRNVMIYLDVAAKKSILERIGRLLPPASATMWRNDAALMRVELIGLIEAIADALHGDKPIGLRAEFVA